MSAIAVGDPPSASMALPFSPNLCRMKAPQRRKRIDEASKLLFMGSVIADLIRIALPALAAELNLDAIEPMPTEFVGMDRSKRIGDSAFRIPFTRPAPDGTRRYALASGEFQDSNDDDMLRRVREYTKQMLDAGLHQGSIRPDDRPLVLPFVIYTGPGGWRAADGTEPMAGLPPEAAREVAPHQPQAYIAVDIGDEASLPAGPASNRFLAAARLVRCHDGIALEPLLNEEWRRFPGAEHERFRAGMYAWVEEALLVEGLQLPTFEQMENAKESEMGQLHINRGLRWREEWREEGRQEGERNLLVRLAGQRFGHSAGKRLADALDGHPTREMLGEAGSLLFACENAEEFIERLDRDRD